MSILNNRCPNCRRPFRGRAEGEHDYVCPSCQTPWTIYVEPSTYAAERLGVEKMRARWER